MFKSAQFSFKEVAPCLFAIFIDVMGFGLVAPILVALFTNPDHNVFHIGSDSIRYLALGLTLALYPLFMFFGTAFVGDLSDVIGRKKTLAFSMFGMTVGFFLMGLGIMISSLFVFFLARAVSGFVAASQSVALATISDLSTKENKAMHLSYIALIQCFGFVVGPLMGGVFSGHALSTPFMIGAFFAAVAFMWITFFFEETIKKKAEKKIEIGRFYKVFKEAYQHKPIFYLSIAFLLMQIGVALYFPIVLILLTEKYGYTTFDLGMFNGLIGVGFALGLIFILPQLLKKFKIEKVVYFSIFSTFLAQVFSSIFHHQEAIWSLAFLYAMSCEVAFSGMFTAFSNAADENSQGWAMGVSVAIMAIAWAFAGLATQLIPIIGTVTMVFIGSLFLFGSGILMKKYYKKYIA